MTMSPAKTAADLTPEDIVELQNPSEVKISPSGKQVVYTVTPATKKGERTKSAVWIADIGIKHSARQLTSGLFQDRTPQWSPDGQSVAFLSDRNKVGKTRAIFLLPLAGGEAYPVTANFEKTVSMFRWSPNGNFIAFLSADEKSEKKKEKEAEKDDAKVYGAEWEYARLRLLHVKTRQIDVIVTGDFHVASFAWKLDSKYIAFTVHNTPQLDSPGYHGLEFKSFNLIDRKIESICKFPGPISEPFVWLDENLLLFLAGRTPNNACTSTCLYQVNTDTKAYEYGSYGYENDASMICSTGKIAVIKVEHGLEDQLDLPGSKAAIFQDEITIVDFDVVNTNEELVYAIITSSPSSPWEVFAASVKTYESGSKAHKVKDLIQVSNHSSSVASLNIGVSESFHCTALGGEQLDAVFFKPATVIVPKPALPTIVLVHGGPYGRTTHCWDPLLSTKYGWAPYLVSAGYGVLCPNYRGSSSHGEKFSSAAHGRMGREDYDDIICITEAAVAAGLVHPIKVLIAGWSQGGSLSYTSAVRNDFPFKAAICGAGVTDWDLLTMTSDFPWFEAALAGAAPWNTAKGASDISARHGSPLWHMQHTKREDRTPLLILHGEEDVRVPVTQAIAFHRGCLAWDWLCEFVVYPREGHRFVERAHLIDMLKRIRTFCDIHLS